MQRFLVEEKHEEPRRARKRGATVSWEELVQPRKRGRGRLRLLRSSSVGRPRKIYIYADEVIDQTVNYRDQNMRTIKP